MDSATHLVQTLRRRVSAPFVVALLGLIILYFVTRLTHLLALPIFSDEGIYINWARTAAYDPAWRFISLIDGKQPLQTWGTIPFIKLLPDNLLLAGRLFSVTTGLVALSGIVTLCGYLWGKRAALVAGTLYIVCPYFVFYDRMALVDSGVNAAVIWILLFSILLARHRRLDIAILFGVVAGFGLLAKSSVGLFVALSAGAVIFAVPLGESTGFRAILRSFVRYRRTVVDFFVLFVLTLCIAVGLYLTQKFFSPFFHYIAQKNLTFILSPQEWLRDPFALVVSNSRLLIEYILWESGWIVPIGGVMGIAMLYRYDKKLAVYISTWIVVPVLLIIQFNKVLFPRYLIFFPSLFVIGMTFALHKIRSVRVMRIAVLASTSFLMVLSYPILFDVRAISLPPVDRGQYIEGQTAVWGAKELMDTVRSSTRDGHYALVLAEGNFGLIADVLSVYVKPGDRIEIRGAWPLNEEHIFLAREESPQKHVFVVFSHRTDFPVHWREYMDLVHVYEKPNNTTHYVYLYRIIPPPHSSKK